VIDAVQRKDSGGQPRGHGENLVSGGWGGVGQIPDVRHGQHERMSVVVRVLA
jgi:hypothetical protein